jgi:hypothetical protein
VPLNNSFFFGHVPQLISEFGIAERRQMNAWLASALNKTPAGQLAALELSAKTGLCIAAMRARAFSSMWWFNVGV